MNKPAVTPPLKTAGIITCKYMSGITRPYFFGAIMITSPIAETAGKTIKSYNIKQIISNVHFYNQVVVRISLMPSYLSCHSDTALHKHGPDVSFFAKDLIDHALKRELDSEIAVMARGENIASNQRRRNMLGKYLLTKPHHVIQSFYGAQMQKLAAAGSSEANREESTFHSDIIHERTSKTVYSTAQTQTERISGQPSAHPVITDSDLNRIATQAAQKVERKIRMERERNGKW